MPPIADNIAETADWPWRNSIRYMVIWPSVMRATTVLAAIHAYAPYSVSVPSRPSPKPQLSRRTVRWRSSL